MSATDWETRELESASRERLLTEIGTLRQAIKMANETANISELKNQIDEFHCEISNLQKSLMASKDFAMGAASRAGEAQAQITSLEGQLGAAQNRVAFLSKHINKMRNSTTWKIGRFVMLPVRVLKKITGKSA